MKQQKHNSANRCLFGAAKNAGPHPFLADHCDIILRHACLLAIDAWVAMHVDRAALPLNAHRPAKAPNTTPRAVRACCPRPCPWAGHASRRPAQINRGQCMVALHGRQSGLTSRPTTAQAAKLPAQQTTLSSCVLARARSSPPAASQPSSTAA